MGRLCIINQEGISRDLFHNKHCSLQSSLYALQPEILDLSVYFQEMDNYNMDELSLFPLKKYFIHLTKIR